MKKNKKRLLLETSGGNDVLSINGGRVLTNNNIEKVVSEIFNKPSECNFTKEQEAVCSPKHVVNKMQEFLSKKGITDLKEPKHIVGNMKDLMNCNSESCVLKKPEFIEFAKISNMKDVINEFFKPSGPATHFGLLSNFNIDDVLEQMEQKFPGFLHIPFQMRDFETIGSELSKIDIAVKFKDGYKTFGVVLNTDYSSGKGIHWYCLFGEKLPDKIILEYFNSSGKEPLAETQAWLQKTKHYLIKTMKMPVDIKYSTGVKFQSDEHSCGVYCLMYLWLRLEGIKNSWFASDNFNDELMHKARKVLFRHEV